MFHNMIIGLWQEVKVTDDESLCANTGQGSHNKTERRQTRLAEDNIAHQTAVLQYRYYSHIHA